jgi:dTMP kinase
MVATAHPEALEGRAAEGRSGFFITLEGGEGSGKSTLAAELARRLQADGRRVVLTEEPGGTPLGQQFWRYLRDPQSPPLTPLAELLWFEAARAQHVETVVRPALAEGAVVICDRYTDSSVAYQGFGRGLGREPVERLNETATGGLKPDRTLLLDLPPEDGLARARLLEEGDGAGKARDAIGGEQLAFHQRVREGFLEIARREPGRVIVIDATRPAAMVAEQAWRAIKHEAARRRRA